MERRTGNRSLRPRLLWVLGIPALVGVLTNYLGETLGPGSKIHALYNPIVALMAWNLGVYVWLCRFLPLPLRQYMREVMSGFDRRNRYFLIFDQLNCGYAKYYTGDEARELMESGGFQNVRTYHRHGMSWTVIGEKAPD